MAKTDTLIDAGPLVAYFDRRDEHHVWARQQMKRIAAPLYTCEAVLSEAFHLLESVPQGVERLLDFLGHDVLDVSFAYADHAGRIRSLMRTYADQPMAFADACLVRMAEVRPEGRVFTTDGDFHVYRKSEGGRMNVVAPDRR